MKNPIGISCLGKIFACIAFLSVHFLSVSSGYSKIEIDPARLKVQSDLLSVYPEKNYTEFTGHVLAHYMGRTLKCNKLKVYLAGTPQKLIRIEAEGNVVLKDKDIVGHCDRMIYTRKDDKVILKGNPRLTSGGNEFRGEIIKFYLTTRRLLIEGGVEADLSPDELQK